MTVVARAPVAEAGEGRAVVGAGSGTMVVDAAAVARAARPGQAASPAALVAAAAAVEPLALGETLVVAARSAVTAALPAAGGWGAAASA